MKVNEEKDTRIFRVIGNFEDEKNLVWFKILKDDTNNFDGFVFRITLENDYKFPRFINTKYSQVNKDILFRKFINKFQNICNNYSFRSDVVAVFPFCQIKWEGGDNTIKSCSVNHFPNCPEIIYNERDDSFYTISPNSKIKTERVESHKLSKQLSKMLKYRVIKIINIFDAQNYITEKNSEDFNLKLDLTSPEVIEEFGKSDNGGYLDRVKDEIVEYMNLQYSIVSILSDKRITITGSGTLDYYILNKENTTVCEINGELIIYLKNFFKTRKKEKECLVVV